MTNHPTDPYGPSDSTPTDGFGTQSPYAPAPQPAATEQATYGIDAGGVEHSAPSTGEPNTSSSSEESKKRRRWVVPVITGVLAFSIGAVAGSGGSDDAGTSAEAAAQVSELEEERDVALEQLEEANAEREDLAAELESAATDEDLAEELASVTAERDDLAEELETITEERDEARAAAEEAEGQIAAAEEAEAEEAAAAAEKSFGNGTWRVGEDIDPGVYRTDGASGCYWERLSGFSGEFGDIIANDFTSGPSTVTIASSDAGFTSQRCGTWQLQE